uniref:Uncharacterized protein n=1 Tax=viral metagenome TaxID=1070528 RepID=A0A6M3M3T7_9ZZZZ
MVHWTFYPVITAVIIGFLVLSYYYLKWARAMDQMNEDHFEFQKEGVWIEGVTYFIAEPTQPLGVLGQSRFPVIKEVD